MIVSICIATYKRPEGLQTLLDKLDGQRFTRMAAPQLDIIIADNEASAATRSLVEKHAARSPHSITYIAEGRRGISYARNASVQAAHPDSKFAAFIDDDSWPVGEWLEELLLTQRQYHAQAVLGPLHPVFPSSAPEWVTKGGFFAAEQYTTGSRRHTGATNNALVATHLLRRTPTPFAPRFAMTGGEDANLFMQLHHEGHVLIWSNEARVFEEIPPSRMTAEWICERGKRCWASHSIIEKDLHPKASVQLMRALKGCLLMLGGAASLLPASLTGDKASKVRARLRIARGMGTLQGLSGQMAEEYRTVHTQTGTVS